MGAILDEELAGLSDEERKALSGEDDAEDREVLRSLVQEGGDEEEEDEPTEDEPEATTTGQEPAVAGQGEAQPGVDPANAAGVTTETGPGEFQPVYMAQPVERYADQMAWIAQQQTTLAKGYEDGDYDLAEYQAKLRALTEHEWGLREQQLKANLAVEQRTQQMAQRWQWEQERFFSQPTNRAYREDPVIGPAFSAAVQLLATDAANNARSMNWFLEEADRMTRARFRLPGEEAPSGANGQQGASQGTGRGGRARGVQVPPTLGGLPAATIPEVGSDEFSRLDRLDGMDLERALAKLSQAEADRYLMGRG